MFENIKNSLKQLNYIVIRRLSNLNEEFYKNAEWESNLVIKYPVNLSVTTFSMLYFIVTACYVVHGAMRNEMNPMKWFNIHYWR